VTRPYGFDFQDNSFYICVKPRGSETSYNVKVPTKGEKPHGIVVPDTWQWPKEQVCIIKAYHKFAEWAKDISNPKMRDWYLEPDKSKVITQ
jgi:LruC domain-containing protein